MFDYFPYFKNCDIKNNIIFKHVKFKKNISLIIPDKIDITTY